MSDVGDSKGFTLLETLIAMMVLSVGLLGMASLTTGIMRGNSFSSAVTTATTLAQAKMEEITGRGYSSVPASGTTLVEDYGAITDYPSYKRVVRTNVVGSTGDRMKMITVTVCSGAGAHSVTLKTIVGQ